MTVYHQQLRPTVVFNKTSCITYYLLKMYPNGNEVHENRFRMVVKCPVAFQYIKDCQGNFRDLIHHIPVCHPGSNVIYKNIYCAMCNGLSVQHVVPFDALLPECPTWTDALLTNRDQKGYIPRSIPQECVAIWQIPGTCARTAATMRCFEMGSNHHCWAYRNPVRSSVVYANQFCEDVPSGNARCYTPPRHVRSINYTTPLFTSIIETNQGFPTLRFRPKANDTPIGFSNQKTVSFMLIILCTLLSTMQYMTAVLVTWKQWHTWYKRCHTYSLNIIKGIGTFKFGLILITKYHVKQMYLANRKCFPSVCRITTITISPIR